MNSVLQSAQVDALYQKLCAENEGHIVIAGVDELYQINAIRYKIQGFHRFLKENPAYGRVYRLVQVCYRQRSQAASVTRSRIYENQLREAANTCNADFPGSVDLRLLTGSFYPVEERMALWRVAKIYLNTALAQGLNLHPQEFLMARKKQGGIVIVSEFTNAHEFLNGALAVNPWNVESMVNELERATEMSNEEMRVCQQRDLDSIEQRERRLWSSQVIQNLLDFCSQKVETVCEPGCEDLSENEVNSIRSHLVVGRAQWESRVAERGGGLLPTHHTSVLHPGLRWHAALEGGLQPRPEGRFPRGAAPAAELRDVARAAAPVQRPAEPGVDHQLEREHGDGEDAGVVQALRTDRRERSEGAYGRCGGVRLDVARRRGVDAVARVPEEGVAVRRGDNQAVSRVHVPHERYHYLQRPLRGAIPLPVQ